MGEKLEFQSVACDFVFSCSSYCYFQHGLLKAPCSHVFKGYLHKTPTLTSAFFTPNLGIVPVSSYHTRVEFRVEMR